MSNLRPYQKNAIGSVIAALDANGSAVLQMPTASGKTRTATAIIKDAEKPTWFICHRQEIEEQAAAAFSNAGIDFGVVSPRAKPDYEKPVQIVSVGTLARRIGDLPKPKLAVWDECHHVAAKSWARIREQLEDAQHLGLTATPERLDGKGLSDWFAGIVKGPSIRDLINDGWLSDFRYFAPSEPDLTGARLRAGDYRKEDVAKAMNMPVLIGDAIAEYKQKADGKRALVFCASVEASQELVSRFNAAGIPARHVDGKTSTIERKEAVAALAAGEIKILSNVEVFTEGFDLPAIDAVILLRPTKSLALYLQMIGRVLRTAEGKQEALIFDHAGLWLDHGWFDAGWDWSLEGGARARRLAAQERGPRRCPECKEVRPERAEVCACGYEFPTGREIGECDGVLREVRSVVPEGWETLASFAKRHGVTSAAVRHWRKRGAPIRGPIIQSDEGDKWVGENVDKSALKAMQATISPRAGLESQKAFASRLGVTQSSVWRWKKIHGMPSIDGSIPVEAALEWVSKNIDIDKSRRRGAARFSTEGKISRKEFATRHGVKAVDKWIEWGMPFDGVFVPVKEADLWVRRNISDVQSEGQKAFARRLSVGSNRVPVWIRSGLPTTVRGRGIHIQRGLEWVRDNTDIEIPPEAWPADNDNAKKDADKAA